MKYIAIVQSQCGLEYTLCEVSNARFPENTRCWEKSRDGKRLASEYDELTGFEYRPVYHETAKAAAAAAGEFSDYINAESLRHWTGFGRLAEEA